ncbi:MAG: c-type cytochrome [Pseudomonadota bacterium]
MRFQLLRYVVLIPIAALGIATASAATASPQPPAVPQRTPLPGNASRGADLYEAKCGACHSLDSNRIGPKHRGVFGRKSGKVPDFHYTAALKRLNVVWNRQALDRWLQNPTAMAPGTAMGYRLTVPQERADIIAYLKQQSPQH